jgi:hypothetical protein
LPKGEKAMDNAVLKKHITKYIKKLKENRTKEKADLDERKQRIVYYQSWTKERILGMTEDDCYEYLSKLWAMLIWGNKRYAIDKIMSENGFDNLKRNIAELVWGSDTVEHRWDTFRANIKGIGPAMMSEILCNTHPDKCIVWNRRAYVALDYLQVQGLPRYDYQLNEEKYSYLTYICKSIEAELAKASIEEVNLLTVDYFFWDELQVEEKLTQIYKKGKKPPIVEPDTSNFIHNEIRDKLADIGEWLGSATKTETKVAEGSQVDSIWEATIGNMGRIIYVFEVQTKGSIDSLIVNLLKSLNNPAVQGVVAVSDAPQLETIRKHASGVGGVSEEPPLLGLRRGSYCIRTASEYE